MADILIADDHSVIRDMVRITLSTQGWTITEAATADQTLDLVRPDPPRAILLDVVLDEDGGGTGFDVCRQLKANPETSRPHQDAAAEALERQRFYESRGHPLRLDEVLALMRAISPEELERCSRGGRRS